MAEFTTGTEYALVIGTTQYGFNVSIGNDGTRDPYIVVHVTCDDGRALTADAAATAAWSSLIADAVQLERNAWLSAEPENPLAVGAGTFFALPENRTVTAGSLTSTVDEICRAEIPVSDISGFNVATTASTGDAAGQLLDANGAVWRSVTSTLDGTTIVDYDPATSQPWDSHTVVTNADSVVLSDTYDYSATMENFIDGGHDLADLHIAQLDEDSAAQIIAEIEREALDGGLVGDHVPSPSVYNYDVFNSGYSIFDQSNYNVTFGISDNSDAISLTTTVAVEDPFGLDGFDFSWLSELFSGLSDAWDWDFGDIDIDWWEPIIFDLDGSNTDTNGDGIVGNGVDLTPRLDSTAYFNLDSDAFLEQTAWMGRGEGMLVIDRPANGGTGAGDGNITRLDEISYSTAPGQSDLAGLRANYDSDGNNVFNQIDAQWANFRVWRDANVDALVNPGELVTLASLGITSINLVGDTQRFMLPDGSQSYGYTTFVMNGLTRQAADMSLAYTTVGFENFHGIGNTPNEDYRTYRGEDGSSLLIRDFHTSSGNASFVLGAAGGIQGVRAGAYNDTITVAAGYTGETWSFGDNGNDSIYGGAGRDVMDGGSGTNFMNGFGGNDTIYFRAGDSIVGGDGFDTGIFVGNTNLTLTLAGAQMESILSGSGNDTISAVGLTVGATIDGRAGNDTITGGAGGDVLVGGLGNDTVNGGGGADLLMGGAGADTLNGDAGDDRIFGGEAIDIVHGNAGNDSLDGGADNDQLFGDDGDDLLEGGAGVDTLNGGAGTDTVTYVNATAGVQVNLTAQNSWDGTAMDFYVSIENAIGTGLADYLVGSSGSNTLDGGGGDDTLDGGAGVDTLNGGAGTDTVTYAGATVGVSIDLTAQNSWDGSAMDFYNSIENASGSAQADYVNGSSGSNILTGGGGADTLLGNAGSDQLFGGDGDDVLDGGTGVDTLNGGNGADTVSYASATAGVSIDLTAQYSWDGTAMDFYVSIENAIGSAHSDIIIGSVSNNILSGGGGADTLTGGAGSDTLNGGDGDDVLDGGTGVDTLNGGAGTDTVTYAGATAGVSIDLTAQNSWDGSAMDFYSSIENAIGTSHADYIVGSAGSNRLDGGAGSDTLIGGDGDDLLNGGTGVDTLNGGSGIDTVSYAGAAAGVSIDLTAQYSWDGSAMDFYSSIENAIGTSHADYIVGSAGSNRFEGGAGSDTLIGYGGDDTFRFASAGTGNDVITDFDADPIGGQDLIDLSGRGFSAGSIGGAIVISGNAGATLITIGTDTITLNGVNVATVTSADFVF